MSLRDDLLAADTDAEKAAVLDAALVAVQATLDTLTSLTSGLAATPAELNIAADQSAQTETLTADGAVSVTKRITKLADTGTGAYTLAAPDAALLGMVKLIAMTADNGNVTLDLTNVVGLPAGQTGATFDDVGDSLVLAAGVSKWIYLNATATLTGP